MARIVHLACASCGHPEMYVVESAENDHVIAEIVRTAGGRVASADDIATSAEARQQKLKSLPTSLPVGGIITPV